MARLLLQTSLLLTSVVLTTGAIVAVGLAELVSQRH
jgi:hypothetical protein